MSWTHPRPSAPLGVQVERSRGECRGPRRDLPLGCLPRGSRAAGSSWVARGTASKGGGGAPAAPSWLRGPPRGHGRETPPRGMAGRPVSGTACPIGRQAGQFVPSRGTKIIPPAVSLNIRHARRSVSAPSTRRGGTQATAHARPGGRGGSANASPAAPNRVADLTYWAL